MTKVVVLGGGVAGLSAAHELAERGFEVEVYEKTDRFGGKARSIPVPNAPGDTGKPLPGEHGFRFFPGFYRHVTDTMKRIPVAGPGGNVFANLVEADRAGLAQIGGVPPFVFPTRLPANCSDLLLVLYDLFAQHNLGLHLSDLKFFIYQLVDFLTYCEDRRFAELGGVAWWDYIDANKRSVPFQKFLAIGLTRCLVAMKAEIACTKTIATILTQMILSMMTGDNLTMDRVLNGPTSDVWIGPWYDYLIGKGVKFFPSTRATGFEFASGQVSSVHLARAGGASVVTADYVVCALPVEVANLVINDAMRAAAPTLAGLSNLLTEWMNGIQFYLGRDVPLVRGHAICADSQWALTSISQPQFWSGVNLADYGDGRVHGIISVDISNWEAPGINGKAANDCTPDEIAKEAWAQLMAHFTASADPLEPEDVLRDADLVRWFMDPDIVKTQQSLRRLTPALVQSGSAGSFRGLRRVAASKEAVGVLQTTETDLEPLLINTVSSWQDRPDAVVPGISNFFLASDYVRTTTDLATMEGANEAARRAVNGVLAACKSSAAPCALFPFKEPDELAPLKARDQARFDAKQPHKPFSIWDFRLLLAGASKRAFRI